jgi:Protein of unknown function (DUF3096)
MDEAGRFTAARPLIRPVPRRNLGARQKVDSRADRSRSMHLTVAHISPLVALIAGVLILIMPRLLNYIVAIYLILVGLMGLNAIHHFIR